MGEHRSAAHPLENILLHCPSWDSRDRWNPQRREGPRTVWWFRIALFPTASFPECPEQKNKSSICERWPACAFPKLPRNPEQVAPMQALPWIERPEFFLRYPLFGLANWRKK